MAAPELEIAVEPRPPRPARAPRLRRTVARWSRRVAWIVVAIGLVAAIVVAWLPKPVPVDVAAARRGALSVTVDEMAKARVKDRFVVSAPLAGTLLRIALKAGDPIGEGEVVARIVPPTPALLDPRTRAEAEERVAAATAGQAQARAAIARADLARERAEHEAADARRLEKAGSVSEDVRERAELEARARIVVWDAPAVVALPSGAVFRHDGRFAAFVVRGGAAELREVELGQRSGPEVEVLSGLTEGDVVIVHPGDRVRAGAKVAPR
jgi:HlyD family secretion protein